MDAQPPRMTQRSMTPSRQQSKDDLEVEELIRQLEKMDLSDPDYAVAYFRACNRHPLVKQIVALPVDRHRVASQSSIQAHPTVPRTRNFERDTPPHVVGGSQNFQPRSDGRACYGCGSMSHTMNRCEALQEYFANGTITRDDRGRIRLTNGGILFRKPEED